MTSVVVGVPCEELIFVAAPSVRGHLSLVFYLKVLCPRIFPRRLALLEQPTGPVPSGENGMHWLKEHTQEDPRAFHFAFFSLSLSLPPFAVS